MTWLISKIVGNPMVLLALLAAAFVAGATSGGSFAWWVQGVRLTAAEQNHTAYVQNLKAQEQENRDKADRKREVAAQQYADLERRLNDEIESGVVYRRCVAAGKCGARVLKPTSCSASIRIQTVSGVDEAGANAIPAGREPAAEGADDVVSDCAVTTLRLNRLQAEIEGQDGYWQ